MASDRRFQQGTLRRQSQQRGRGTGTTARIAQFQAVAVRPAAAGFQKPSVHRRQRRKSAGPFLELKRGSEDRRARHPGRAAARPQFIRCQRRSTV